jgi:hypothetical protein
MLIVKVEGQLGGSPQGGHSCLVNDRKADLENVSRHRLMLIGSPADRQVSLKPAMAML